MFELNVCNYLGVSPDQLLVCREDGEDIVVVVDNGIKGCPKYRIPKAELLAVAENEPEEAPAEAENEPEEAPAGAENEPEEAPAGAENEPEEAPAEAENAGIEVDQDATDAAIKLAAESGVDLAGVAGTGQGGKVTIGDVRCAIDAAKCDGDGPDTD